MFLFRGVLTVEINIKRGLFDVIFRQQRNQQVPINYTVLRIGKIKLYIPWWLLPDDSGKSGCKLLYRNPNKEFQANSKPLISIESFRMSDAVSR